MKAFGLLAAAMLAAPALAQHPEGRLDEEMAGREPAFEPTDSWSVPGADLAHADLDLSSLEDQIVVLSFVPKDCGQPCSAQQAQLAKALDSVNVTPMREMVTFLTIGPGDAALGGAKAPNARNSIPGGDESIAAAADRFAAVSTRGTTVPQVHVIGRGGRHAGIFHGAEFGHVNLVLYINGLSNAQPQEPPLWNRLMGVLG